MTRFDNVSWICDVQENITCGGGKGGGGSQSSTVTSQPPEEVMKQYQSVINQGNQVSQQPLQLYSGQMVAPFTGMQNQAFDSINQAQGIGSPYLNQAASNYQTSTNPLWGQAQQFSPQAVQQYMNPYTQNVVDATRANMQENNAVQQQGLIGNAISKGAWGGDRAGIAQAELSRQQKLADDQTISGLYNQAYQTGLGTFQQQQGAQLGANSQTAALNQQAAQGYAGLGNQALTQALSGAGAQLQAGTLQQQLSQQALNVPYQQYQQTQGFPYQNTQFLAGVSGLGSQMGGTSTSTQPAPNGLSQGLGSLIGIGGLLSNTGAFGATGWLTGALGLKSGGSVKGYAPGGNIFDVPEMNMSVIPQSNMSFAPAQMPQVSPMPQDNQSQKNMEMGLGLLAKAKNKNGSGWFPTQDAADAAAAKAGITWDTPEQQGLDSFIDSDPGMMWGEGFASGGYMPGVRRFTSNAYADGGDVDQDLIDSGVGQSLIWGGDPDMADYADSAGLGAVPDASQSIVPQPVPMAQAPQPQQGIPAAAPQVAQPAQTADPAQAGLGGISGADFKSDPGLAIAAAGFGMAAGQSPQFGVNVGQGGLAGIKNWQDQKNQERQAAQLMALMDYRKSMLAKGVMEIKTDPVSGRLVQINKMTGEQTPVSGAEGMKLAKDPAMALAENPDVKGEKVYDLLAEPDAETVKSIVQGKSKPPTPMQQQKPYYKGIMQAVRRADPSYSDNRFTAVNDFAIKKHGDQIRSFNVGISHVNMLAPLIAAMDNGDVQAINSARNEFKRQTGDDAPTNFDLAKKWVSDETSKALIGGQTAQHDRERYDEALKTAGSPKQLLGALNTTKQFMGGQLKGLAQQYKTATGLDNFNDFLEPEALSEVTGTKAATGEKLPTFSSSKDPGYDKLPKGATFINKKTGKPMVKH